MVSRPDIDATRAARTAIGKAVRSLIVLIDYRDSVELSG
jgi:hypothetical protein